MSRAHSILLAALLALALPSAAAAGPRGRTPQPAVVARGLAAYAAARAEGRIRNPVLTVIDYSLPSSERRLWVLEPESKQVLFHEFVAHGFGSTDPDRPERAVRFGNELGSQRSSLGAFLTGEPYEGTHGHSLQLVGLERGLNDRAEERRIVMHPAWYASRAFRLDNRGRLGRSFGCPALDPAVATRIIERIRSGSMLYAAGPSS